MMVDMQMEAFADEMEHDMVGLNPRHSLTHQDDDDGTEPSDDSEDDMEEEEDMEGEWVSPPTKAYG